MKVSDALSHAPDLLGEQVELEGYFFLSGDCGYFVDCAEDRDDHVHAIRVDIPDIETAVMANVPPFGGGKYCYADAAEIVGSLFKCDSEDDFKYRISSVESFVICRSGERLSVLDRMQEQAMKVSSVVSNATELLGTQVELAGIFILVGEDGYLVDTFDERDDLAGAIRIDIPAMLDFLTPKVPPNGGSKYYFADPAVLVGQLLECEDGGEIKLRISDITKFVINKSGYIASVLDV